VALADGGGRAGRASRAAKERPMSMAIQGGISPEDIIAFIQQHTDDYAAQIKGEMQAAQDRTNLVKDIADVAAKLEDYKTRKDWNGMRAAIDDFRATHEDTWGGHAHDMSVWREQAIAWSGSETIKAETYVQKNNPDATDAASSYTVVYEKDQDWGDDQQAAAQAMTGAWIQELNNWKDEVSGDDKIGMMKLQEDADRLKNLYELGSNLVAKIDGVASSIINNIGKA
jgi:hypothetical protein